VSVTGVEVSKVGAFDAPLDAAALADETGATVPVGVAATDGVA